MGAVKGRRCVSVYERLDTSMGAFLEMVAVLPRCMWVGSIWCTFIPLIYGSAVACFGVLTPGCM